MNSPWVGVCRIVRLDPPLQLTDQLVGARHTGRGDDECFDYFTSNGIGGRDHGAFDHVGMSQ